jgi:hypothetical protein
MVDTFVVELAKTRRFISAFVSEKLRLSIIG